MRKLWLAFVLVVPLLATPAVAQQGDVLTSLDPLHRIVESFDAGEDAGGLVITPQADAADAIVSQFQFVFNHASSPEFGEEDNEFIPFGVEPGADLELVDLEDEFGTRIGWFDFFPPLDPWSSDGGRLDVSEIFDGWDQYTEDGLVEGPVILTESTTVAFGMELAAPIDPSCDQPFHVGRSWQGESVGSDDPPLTEEALSGFFGDTHSALADGETRFIELGCTFGELVVDAWRMTDDRGVRGFGPVKAVAMVKDTKVIFFIPTRILDADLQPSFYATPAGGGPVVRSETDGDIRALVPNPPYSDYQYTLEISVVPEEEAAGLAPPGAQAQTLLNRYDNSVVLTGTDCSSMDPVMKVQLVMGISALTGSQTPNLAGATFFLFGMTTSTTHIGQGNNDGTVTISGETPSGQTQTINIDVASGTGTIEKPGDEPCTGDITVGGTAIATGDDSTTDVGSSDDGTTDDGSSGGTGSNGDDGTTSGSDDDAGRTDRGSIAGSPTGGDSSGGGFIWLLVGLFGILGVAFLLWWFMFGNRDRYVYRADRSGDDIVVDKDPGSAGDDDPGSDEPETAPDEPLVLEGVPVDTPPAIVEEPDTTFEDPCWEESRKLQEAEDRLRALEAEQDQVESGTETAKQLIGAIENARKNVASAQKILDECIARNAPPPAPASGGTAPPPQPEDTGSDDPDDGGSTDEPSSGGGTGRDLLGSIGEETDPACKEGAEDWRRESRSRRFTVLDGDIKIRISNAPVTWSRWQNANGTSTTVTAAALSGLDDDQMEELLDPLPDNRRVIPRITISTKTVRVHCERLYRCQGGQWVRTNQVRKNPQESPGDDERFGGKDVSTVDNIIDLINQAKERIAELEAELDEGRAFECEG